ncbi:MAG TPA: septal ring lytic transglycosylase RlpA family protein [Terriglobales bacterium]|nr:septal ring lytic transglycosylase RlpA family protein [Terriglobales bacterium]
MVRFLALLAILPVLLACLTGCASHKQARVNVPPGPSEKSRSPAGVVTARTSPGPPTGQSEAADETLPPFPAGAKPILVESGLASWYGAPYHQRRESNGEIYDMHAMTAAHRTLPLSSIVRVTNVKTGSTAVVRITDRGPFVPGRILDLSFAAAKKLDVWQAGVAEVKMEVMQAPAPLRTGGRWAVQIGSFGGREKAVELANQLSRRYHTAKVLTFPSPTGDWWLRVRVLNDDRQRAEALAGETRTPEGAVFLVRLD